MRFGFVFTVAAGIISSAAVAEAKSTWQLYGAVPVAGDRHLELAYSDALSRCRLEGYRTRETDRVFHVQYDAPETRSCLSRKGFIYQNGDAHAYPVPKGTYTVR
ncbi:hypothetical protein EDF70_112105 [Neorhizobium sp. JUb45]|nr:hypothetical protein EDF70_112105 [Neorhizobium sp. JUb45]